MKWPRRWTSFWASAQLQGRRSCAMSSPITPCSCSQPPRHWSRREASPQRVAVHRCLWFTQQRLKALRPTDGARCIPWTTLLPGRFFTGRPWKVGRRSADACLQLQQIPFARTNADGRPWIVPKRQMRLRYARCSWRVGSQPPTRTLVRGTAQRFIPCWRRQWQQWRTTVGKPCTKAVKSGPPFIGLPRRETNHFVLDCCVMMQTPPRWMRPAAVRWTMPKRAGTRKPGSCFGKRSSGSPSRAAKILPSRSWRPTWRSRVLTLTRSP
mmetsp:Transcript_11709/g.28026  ORF Transcript_11709/g.28026 Transcript_11709/m.28026 type:complete len:267 (-) Transcript_11709:89-889(-)